VCAYLCNILFVNYIRQLYLIIRIKLMCTSHHLSQYRHKFILGMGDMLVLVFIVLFGMATN
jgi:hypothetical protein